MLFAKSSRSFIAIRLSILLIVHNYGLSAAILTYDGCVSDSANSYRMGGWCFYLYYNSSWANCYPSQDVAQTLCGPYGNLAVGVTYKMINTFKAHPKVVAGTYAWLALISNSTSAKLGWMWNTILPDGSNVSFPAVMSNIPWYPGDPNNGNGNSRSGIIKTASGIVDIKYDFTVPSVSVAVVCQFAPRQWKYSQRGQGRFNVTSGYLIAQSTVIKLDCLRQCHQSPGCVSMAYNPSTSDCQIYSVSPEDPRFSANDIVDSDYNFYIRDGMEY